MALRKSLLDFVPRILSSKNSMLSSGDIPADGVDLPQHLIGSQIPRQTQKGGGTETASHPAAGLGGNTDGISVSVLHQDALNHISVTELKQVLFCPVDCRLIDFCHPDPHPGILRKKYLFQPGRHIGHLSGVTDQASVDPAVDLVCAKALAAGTDHCLCQFFLCHRSDVLPLHLISPCFISISINLFFYS